MGAQPVGSNSETGLPERFRTSDVARILGVSSVRVRTMVRSGLCQPGRRGRAFAFRFQDLVLLRTAHGLIQANVPTRRVKRALNELARQLPPGRPLSGVRIYADGRRVVVRDGRGGWQPESGQRVLAFTVDELTRQAHSLPRAARCTQIVQPASRESAEDWFNHGLALEEDDAQGACEAYRRAVELDPNLGDARVNLGRLLHEGGDPKAAVSHYRRALEGTGDDHVTHYNLALALEDIHEQQAALAHYHRALELNPDFADAHFNLGRLLERTGREAQALRHLMAYRRLTESG